MITRADINDRVRLWGLREDVVEKDYVLGWVLWGIGTDQQLDRSWVFKGGTCLKKCYIETYRFSEDLDFTVLEDGPIEQAEVLEAISRVLDRVNQESGIDFALMPPAYQSRPLGPSAEVRVYYRGPRNTPGPARIKFDLTMDEKVVCPPVLRSVSHDYTDALPPPGQVRCYSFEEVFAEKLRAMGERSRPRDLYDIVNLFRRPDFRPYAGLVLEVLKQKCESKGVSVPSAEAISESPMFEELKSEWENMLAHQLRALPAFDHFWAEVPRIFAWLNGAELADELELWPLAEGEEFWEPPHTFWTSGQGTRLEPVRFAAVNRLLVNLGYRQQHRLIEPYSLRQTGEGNILLHAIRADGGGNRAYRVDRIESAEVTTHPFTPRFLVEFPASGTVPAPPSPRRHVSRSAGVRRSNRPEYVVLCVLCEKRFRRTRRSTQLRPHKDPGGWDCPGRSGYMESVG